MTSRARLAAVALASVVVVEGLGRTTLGTWADQALADAWVVARGSREVEPSVVLIAIDDESQARNPDPMLFWGPAYARAIEALRGAGATAVGLDLVVRASGEGWLLEHGLGDAPASRSWDASFRGQLAQGDVVLATLVAPEGDGSPCLPPVVDLAMALPSADANLGFVNFGEDSDGVIRRFRPVVAVGEPHGACPRAHFALQLALRHAGLDSGAATWSLGGRTVARDGEVVPIGWAGPRGTFPVVPFWKLAEGALTPEEAASIRGRVALIGTDHVGNADLWVTPYDRFAGEERRRMAGVEVEAHAVTTLLEGWRVQPLGPVARLVGLGAAALLLSAAFGALSLELSAGVLVAHTLAWPLAGYAAFAVADTVVPGTSGMALGGLVFAGAYAVRFAGEARERRRLRDVFGRYVSDEVVDELLSSPDKLALGGQRREITILFSDIRSFTSISEKLAPEEVVEMLNAYFERACPPISAQHGRVDKFVGDAVMAVFGAPTSQPDHAKAACRAAVGMARAAVEFRSWMDQRFPNRGLPTFDIGVGVHTGWAVAGNIGYDRALEYAVIGDAVNAASRLEGMTKEVGVRVLISRATRDAAGAGVVTGKRDEVHVKGRAEAIEVFELVDVEA